MIKKFVIKKSACVTVAVVFGLSLFALAQADAAAGSPAAAATTPNAPSATAAAEAKATGTKVGTINTETVLLVFNQGPRDFGELTMHFRHQQNDITSLSDLTTPRPTHS